MILNDREIRASLLERLKNGRPRPVALLEELHVDFGRAIADVVALYEYPHCFEIKGETDKIQRVLTQEEVFSRAFTRMTLVTTSNHLAWATKHVPTYWGILAVSHDSDRTVFRKVRSPRRSPWFSREISLRTIWRPELMLLANSLEIQVSPKENKTQIAAKLASSLSSVETVKHIAGILKSRLDQKVPQHEG